MGDEDPPALWKKNADVKEIKDRDTGGQAVIVDVGKGADVGVGVGV